jgi:hypothetical protein
MYSFPKPENWPSLPLYKKIQIYKNNLDERFAPFVDKLQVKESIKEFCQEIAERFPSKPIHEFCQEIAERFSFCQTAKLIRILDSPDDVSEKDLNPDWMVKATHGSGWNIPITATTTTEEVKKKLKEWNTVYVGSNEKHYQFIKPRFFIEEKIEDAYIGKTGQAIVFMFRCIHGKAVTIGVKKGEKQNMYRITGECIGKAFPFLLPWHRVEEMKTIAEQLAQPFEFVRMDFYLGVKGDIYFSEYTFSPAGGQCIYSKEIEEELGALWQ